MLDEGWWSVREIKGKAALAVQTAAPSPRATQAMWRQNIISLLCIDGYKHNGID